MKDQHTALKDFMEYLNKASSQRDLEEIMIYVDLANSRFHAWTRINKDCPEKKVAVMAKLMAEIYNDVEQEMKNPEIKIDELYILCEDAAGHYKDAGKSI